MNSTTRTEHNNDAFEMKDIAIDMKIDEGDNDEEGVCRAGVNPKKNIRSDFDGGEEKDSHVCSQDEIPSTPSKKIWLILVVIVSVVAGILFIAVASMCATGTCWKDDMDVGGSVSLMDGNNDHETTTTSIQVDFLLPAFTQETIQTNPSAPQSRAYNWFTQLYNTSQVPSWRQPQLFALATLFYSLNGDAWHPKDSQNWLNPTANECEEWTSRQTTFSPPTHQIECNQYGEVTALRLISFTNPPHGRLPPELELLTSLEVLEIRQSSWQGPVQSKLPFPHLKHVKHLDLSFNRLSGSLPFQLSEMSQLTHLSLHSNDLSGSLPSQLGNLVDLNYLNLSENYLTGSLPSSLGNLRELADLQLHHNPLTGSVPPSICALSIYHPPAGQGLLNLFSLDCPASDDNESDSAGIQCPDDCTCQCW